jgi:hypothetical protein
VISDEDVARYEKTQRHDKEYLHGRLGVEAARIRGILPNDEMTWEVDREQERHVYKATDDIDKTLQNWQHQLEESSIFLNAASIESNVDGGHHETQPEVRLLSDLCQPMRDPKEKVTRVENELDETEVIKASEFEELNDDQRRAYSIVDWHLKETIGGKEPPQLLMLIPGEGGVGKTKLIQTMSRHFEREEADHWLVKGAYTGIAASLIDGKTLHVLGGIPVKGRKQSAQTLKKLREFWRTKRYLIIDEVSMLSRCFFARFSRIISTAMEVMNEQIFGGLNVILVGHFHQFPPVVARRSAPLYWPADSRHDSEEDILGRKIFEQFSTVVRLNKQVRVRDEIWHDVLQHVRYGNCQQHHIDIIKKLVITNPDCSPTDYNSFPWKDARLVTPRHAVRTQWNSAAIKKHCAQTRNRLYVCPAEDMINGRPVTNEEKIAIMTRVKGSNSQMDRGGLMKEIELAIGAPVMVTLNIRTELDVANGVRGVIEAIVLDERERQTGTKEAQTIHLQYPPRYVLVRLNRTKAPCLEGLEQNIIPITPVTKSFTTIKDATKITATRTQLPLTLAYAFTDYRSQGQTLQPVIRVIQSCHLDSI